MSKACNSSDPAMNDPLHHLSDKLSPTAAHVSQTGDGIKIWLPNKPHLGDRRIKQPDTTHLVGGWYHM